MIASCINIPRALFLSDRYKKLTDPSKVFLINLYSHFDDCQYFSIDKTNPDLVCNLNENFAQRKIKVLVDVGLLIRDDTRAVPPRETRRGPHERVYSFLYRW